MSPAGALLLLDRPSPLRPGDEIDLGIAWNPSRLIHAGDMVRGRVVRVVARTDGAVAVAVEMETGARLARAA